MFYTSNMRFTHQQLLLPGFGHWSFLSETLKDHVLACSIWHYTDPLKRFLNTHTSQIIASLQNGVRDWLDPYSMSPVAIPERCRLVSLYQHHRDIFN